MINVIVEFFIYGSLYRNHPVNQSTEWLPYNRY